MICQLKITVNKDYRSKGLMPVKITVGFVSGRSVAAVFFWENIGVGKILSDYSSPEHLIVAGILHDMVEDTLVRLDEIKQTFGWDIVDLVEAASEPEKSDTGENRKNYTIGMLKSLSKEAAILVLADKLDNIRTIREDYERYGEGLWPSFKLS